MSEIKLFIDEDAMNFALVNALRSRDVDIITVGEVGRKGKSDEEQLLWATSQERVLYSFNARDFCSLHEDFLTEGRTHGGIVIGQQQRFSVGQQLRGIIALKLATTAEKMQNQLKFISQYIRG